MKETQLKKEFKERDIQRARNLITKDYTSRTQAGTGYRKVIEHHKEGDIWEEDGKSWTIKNGLKQTITKLDKAKKLAHLPLACPKCKGTMKHRLSKKMWKIHKMCYDCVIDYEAELKKAGLYEAYEKQMVLGNIRTFAKDAEEWLFSTLEETDTFVTEDGDIEEWKSNNKYKEEALKNVREYMEYLNKQLDGE